MRLVIGSPRRGPEPAIWMANGERILNPTTANLWDPPAASQLCEACSVLSSVRRQRRSCAGAVHERETRAKARREAKVELGLRRSVQSGSKDWSMTLRRSSGESEVMVAMLSFERERSSSGLRNATTRTCPTFRRTESRFRSRLEVQFAEEESLECAVE